MNRFPTTWLAVLSLAIGSPAVGGEHAHATVPEELKQRVEAEGWSQQWHDQLYDHKDPAVGAVLRQMLRAKRDAAALKSGLIVHEWGAMQHHLGNAASDFDLIGEDQSDLPKFVKVWADQPVQGPRVIRKPILYFYTKQKQKVNVTVRFPEGVLTQWYPDVSFFTPQRDHRVPPPGGQNPPRNGTLVWNQVELNPQLDANQFAHVDQNHPWWHIARDTDATPISAAHQQARGGLVKPTIERFLFYRGAGNYTPMVLPKRDKPGVDLSVKVPFSQIDLRGVFLVRVNNSGATITHAPVLRANSTLQLAGPDQAKPTEAAAETAKAQLIDSLEAAGLFPKEARGLVRIWGDDMFTTPGERLLYLMPNNEADRLLPLNISPAPKQTVRTLIAWVELSTPESENRIMSLVKQLGSQDANERDAADKELRTIDHFAEGILKRVVTTTTDAEVRQRLEKILAALAQKRSFGKSTKPR